MMKDFKIRNRLLLGFGVVMILLIFVSIFSMIRMTRLAKLTTDLYEYSFTVTNTVRDIEINTSRMHQILKDVLLSENAEELENAVDSIDNMEKIVYEKLGLVSKRYLGDQKDVDKVREEIAYWKPIRDEIIAQARKNEKAAALALAKGKGMAQIQALDTASETLIVSATKRAENFMKNAWQSEKNSFIIVGIIDILAVALSLTIAYLITLSITRPVSIAVGVSERLSRGEITADIPVNSRDELGKMLEAMKKMSGNLKEQMREIKEGIGVLSGSAAEISTAAAQFATTTREVAASVNQVVVSMKQVKQTTELSKDKAREMMERSKGVVQTSRGGEASVRQTIEVIDAIREQMHSIADSVVGLSEKSQFIGEIIAAVDDVADQSRFLAVNASIEAVKAGEQGKGFTVVADEIKNLAQQSKQSTSQVRNILNDIQKATGAAVMATEKGSKAVESGVSQAKETGIAIRALGENIDQTSQAAVQIEATGRQQAAGIDQVFSAMESIGDAISQNAQSARQLEISTHDLDELGKKLKTIVEKYTL